MHLLYVTVSLFLYLTVGRVIYRLFCSCVSFLEDPVCGVFFVCGEQRGKQQSSSLILPPVESDYNQPEREREGEKKKKTNHEKSNRESD